MGAAEEAKDLQVTKYAISKAYELKVATKMLNWAECEAIERTPEKLSGAPVFKNSRVPVAALFQNLEGGASVDEFLEWFPGVSREYVDEVLKFAERSLASV